MHLHEFLAVDPLALILRSDIYVRLHLPRPLPIEILQDQVKEAVRGMSAEERSSSLTHVRSLAKLVNAVEQELTRTKGEKAA
jgi:hypothetical protein